VLAITTAAFGQDPDAAAQKKIIFDVQAKALDYLKNPPNYTCSQVMRHNVDASGTNAKWKLLDTVHARLTMLGSKEDYEVLLVGGKKPSHPENRPAGLMSLDEFNELLADIFDPKVKATFSWSKEDSLRGHRVNEIAYKVEKGNSSMTIGKKDLTVGLLGILYADAETGAVLRIANVDMDIPAKYPLQAVSVDQSWEYMKVGDQVALVPIKADFHEKEGKSLIWNEIEYRDFKPEAVKKTAR
jgi:hypothetical protein